MKKNILIGLGVLIVISTAVLMWFHYYYIPSCDDFEGFCWGTPQAKVEKRLDKKGLKDCYFKKNAIICIHNERFGYSSRITFLFKDGKLFLGACQPEENIKVQLNNKSSFIKNVQDLQDQLIQEYGESNRLCSTSCINSAWEEIIHGDTDSFLLFSLSDYKGTNFYFSAHQEPNRDRQPEVILMIVYFSADHTLKDAADFLRSDE